MSDTLHQSILSRMYSIHQSIRRKSDAILGIEQLTLHQLQALMFIKQHHHSRVSDLAEDFGISAASASVLVERMVEAGWIERVNDPDDRRVSFLRLTPDSEKRLRSIQDHRTKALGQALDTLSPSEQQELEQILVRVLSALEEEQEVDEQS